MTNPASDRVFTDAVADLYDELMVPLFFEPYSVDLVHRLDDLENAAILEIAAGTGVVTRALAAALPDTVTITATDLNQAMIDRAIRTGTARTVVWEQADAGSLPYAENSFDVVVCQFGAMFFPAKSACFGEVHRVLRSGGRFVFNVWDCIETNEFADVVTDAVGSLFPADPPRFLARTPHGYHDPQTILEDLRAGGFGADIQIEPVEARSRAAKAADVAMAYCQGSPLRDEIVARDPDHLAEATEVATAALVTRFGPTDLDGLIRAWVITAVK